MTRNSTRLRLVTAALVAIACTSACKSESPGAASPGTSDPETPPEAPEKPGHVRTPAPPPVCAAGGRPWDGKPKDCLYEVDRCCYDTPETACAAAGCPAAACQILESYPAQIACREGASATP